MIHPKPPGHIQIVLEQGRNFGLTNDEMIEYEMLPECRAFLEYYRGVLYEGTMVEWWASFCVEEAVGHWAQVFWRRAAGRILIFRKTKSSTFACTRRPISKSTTA